MVLHVPNTKCVYFYDHTHLIARIRIFHLVMWKGEVQQGCGVVIPSAPRNHRRPPGEGNLPFAIIWRESYFRLDRNAHVRGGGEMKDVGDSCTWRHLVWDSSCVMFSWLHISPPAYHLLAIEDASRLGPVTLKPVSYTHLTLPTKA